MKSLQPSQVTFNVSNPHPISIALAQFDCLCLFYYSSVHICISPNQFVEKGASHHHVTAWTYDVVNSVEISFGLRVLQFHIFYFWCHT